MQKEVRSETIKLRAENPLQQVGFLPPLSVAGCGSRVIVRAEGLIHQDIPVAILFDEAGLHRGPSLEDVCTTLYTQLGSTWDDDVSILNL